MILQLHAACGCHTGNVRRNNEDNFYFNGRTLPMAHNGLSGTAAAKYPVTGECCFGVFDGMGGEAFGEAAAFLAADTLRREAERLHSHVVSPRPFLEEACAAMNRAVWEERSRRGVHRMGTAAAMLLFIPDEVYACNLGDTRIYRLRDSELMQLSRDHVAFYPPDYPHTGKPGLTQYLGMEEERKPTPRIAKGDLRKGDTYLICSDGLTDMVTNMEIYNCLQGTGVRQAAGKLIGAALEKGGKDNITVIVIGVE